MQRDTVFTRPLRDCDNLVPRPQRSADVAFRKLEDKRAKTFTNALQVIQTVERIAIADRYGAEVVEPRQSVTFVDDQMTLRMQPHVANITPVAMYAKGDLLRHDAARHKNRSFFAEQFRKVGLKRLEQIAATVNVRLLIFSRRVRNLKQLLSNRKRRVSEKARTRALNFVAGHGAGITAQTRRNPRKVA